MQEIAPHVFDFLGDAEAVPIKFGGENTADVPGTLATIQALRQTGRSVFPVFSAPRGEVGGVAYNTTDKLVALGDACMVSGPSIRNVDFMECKRELRRICETVRQLMEASLKVLEPSKAQRFKDLAGEIIDARQEEFMPFVEEAATTPRYRIESQSVRHGRDRVFESVQRRFVTFTGFGELLATDVYAALLRELGIAAESVDTQKFAPGAFLADRLSPQENAKKPRILGDPVAELASNSYRDPIVCLPGYAPGVAYSKGYSDILAMLCARALIGRGKKTAGVVAKQWPIWSKDPRKGGGQLVPDAGKDFASNSFEHNGGNASALHPDAVDLMHPDADFFVGNPGRPERGFTRITAKNLATKPPRVELIAETPIPVGVTVKGGGMADRSGVYEAVLAEFKNVSIGHTPTDAITIMVTFHEAEAATGIARLQDVLRSKGDFVVEPLTGHSWVHCLGNRVGLRERSLAGLCLADAGFETDWDEGTPNAAKFLIPSIRATEAIDALHAALIRPY